MSRSAIAWLALGWIGFAALPWYFAGGGSAGDAGSASGLLLGIRSQAWLLPLVIPLAVGLFLLRLPAGSAAAAKGLIGVGVAGLAWLVLEAAAIEHRGWSWSWLSSIAGSSGPKQGGMGYGAFLTGLSLLMLLTHGLAGRGACRGDAFTASAIGLVLGAVLLFTFFPIVGVLESAFRAQDGAFSAAEFAARFTDRSIWGLGCLGGGTACGVAWNTLLLAVLVGSGTTLLGLVFALLAARIEFRGKLLLRALTVLPIITPPFVIGLAIILLFGRSGALTGVLADLLDVPRSRWIYGLPGVFFAQMLAFTPIAFLVLLGVVQGISPSMEEASQMLRASRWQTFHTVTLPLLRPGLANAFLVGFVESMADFGNPLVLGGNYEVLSTKIFFSVVGSANDSGRAAVLAIILLGFTLAAFAAQQLWLGRKSYVTVSGKGDSGLPAVLPRRVTWGCYALALPWAVLTFAIYVTILVGGFVKVMGRDYTPTLAHFLTGFSIEWGTAGLHFTGSAWPSLGTTVALAAIAAPITAGLGLLTAWLLERQQFTGRRAFEFITMLSFAIPGTVVGVSYILAFNVPPIEITGTGLILVVCFVFRNMPVGIRSGVAALAQIDKSLDEASMTLRARSMTTIRRVMMPLLRPAMIAALVYAFVRAMTAVSAVIFLVSAEYNLATAYIVGRVEAGEFGLAIAYSSVLIVIMAIAIAVIQFVVGERKLGRRAAGTVAVQGAG